MQHTFWVWVWVFFFGVTPEYTAGGSRSFHLLSWALANVPSLFAWGLPTFFPSHSATVVRCSYPVPLLPALYPHRALPVPTLPTNRWGLLQGQARRRG